MFPYNKENIDSFYKKLLSVLIILNKKQINFNIFINKNTFKFIYNKNQNDKLNGDLYLDKNNYFFLQKTRIYIKKFKYSRIIKNEAALCPNKENSILFLELLEQFSSKENIQKEEVEIELKRIRKNISNVKIVNKNLLINNLFQGDINSSRISNIWSIIYNFYNNDILFDYLNKNLNDVESDLLATFKSIFDNLINYDINEIVKISYDLLYFCGTKSILWKSIIGQYNFGNINENEKVIYLNQIEKEIKDISLITYFDISKYKNKLNKLKDELNQDINSEPIRIKIEEELQRKLEKLLNEDKYKKYKLTTEKLIIKVKKAKGKPTEEIFNILKNKVKEFIDYIEIDLKKEDSEINIWPEAQNGNEIEGKNKDFLKCIIWYSEVKEIFDNIKKLNKNNENKNMIEYITRLCNYNELVDISAILYDKFIFKEKNASISIDDINFIEGYLKIKFLLKLNEYDILNSYYLNFEKRFNDMIERDKQNINFYNYVNLIANKYDTHFKLIFPEFKSGELYYLFILPTSENKEKYRNGPLLFEYQNINLQKLNESMKFNFLKEDNFREIIFEILNLLMKEREANNDISLSYNLESYNKLIKSKIENDDFYKILDLGKEIAELLENNYNSRKKFPKKYSLNFEDLTEFTNENIKKGYEYFIKNKYLNNKYPSLIFYFGKYKANSESLFKKLETSGTSIKDNEKSIPFWIICLRILSSYCCIDYGQNIFLKDDLKTYITKKLQECVNQNIEIDPSWLNFILKDVPLEVLSPKIRIYYDFFNNLSNSIGINDEIIKIKIEKIIREMHQNIISCFFSNDKDPLNENFENRNALRDFLVDPSKYIFNMLKNILKEKLNKIMDCSEYKDLLKIITEYINNYDSRIKDLKEKIRNENEKNFLEYKRKLEDDYEKKIKEKIREIKYKINEYNDKINKIEKDIKDKEKNTKNVINNQSCNENENLNKKIIFQINKNCCDQILDLKNYFTRNKYTNFDDKVCFKITKLHYEYNAYYADLIIKINNNNNENIKLESTILDDYLYFNYLEMDNIVDILASPSNKNEYKSYINSNNLKKYIQDFSFKKLKNIDNEENLKNEIKKIIKLKDPAKDAPIVTFNGLNQDQFIKKLSEMKNILLLLKNILENINKIISFSKMMDLEKNLEIKYDEIKKNSSSTVGNELCQNIINSYQEFGNNIENSKIKFNSFIKECGNYKDIIESIIKIKRNNDIFTKSFNVLRPEKPNKIRNFTFNEKDLKKIDLSIPFISLDEKKKKLEFCYKDKLEKTIGPICPNFYNDFIRIRILNSIKDRKLITKIKQNEIIENNNKIFNELVEKNDIKNVDLNSEIPKNVNIIIRLRIPKLIKSEEETHLYNFDLILKTEKINNENEYELIIHCKFFIKLIPISILLISEHYNLKWLKDKNFILCTDKLTVGEEIKFKLSNYFNNEIIDYDINLNSFDDNMIKDKPLIDKIKGNEIVLKIKEIKENYIEFKKLHCELILILAEDFLIKIEINAFIIPINFSLSLYDYTKKEFLEEGSIIYYNENMIKQNYKINLFLKLEINNIENNNLEGVLSINFSNKYDEEKKIILKNQIIKYGIILKKNICLNYPLIFTIKYNKISSIANATFKRALSFNLQNHNQISKNFDVYYYNKEKFELLQRGVYKDEILNYSLIYPFDTHIYEEYLFITLKNKSEFIIETSNPERTKYFLIDEEGEIEERKLRKKKENIKNEYNKSIIFNNIKKPFFLSYKHNEKYYMLPLIADIYEKFSKWGSIDELNIIIDNINSLKDEKIKNKSIDYKTILNLESLFYILINKKKAFKNLMHFLENNFEKKTFKDFEENFNNYKKEEKKIYIDKMIISLFYFFKREYFLEFNKKIIFFHKPNDNLIEETLKKSKDKYYFFDENDKNRSLVTNNNIELLNTKISKIKYNYEEIKDQKIFLIESNRDPELKNNEEKKIIKEDSFSMDNKNIFLGCIQNELPSFKTPLLDKIILPKNILEIIDFYYNLISDSRTLPLYLLREINIIPKTEKEKIDKKKRMKELESRFTTLLSFFKGLKKENDYSILSKVFWEFSESMHDMLSKFKAGKTEFENLLPNEIKLNRRIYLLLW